MSKVFSFYLFLSFGVEAFGARRGKELHLQLLGAARQGGDGDRQLLPVRHGHLSALRYHDNKTIRHPNSYLALLLY